LPIVLFCTGDTVGRRIRGVLGAGIISEGSPENSGYGILMERSCSYFKRIL